MSTLSGLRQEQNDLVKSLYDMSVLEEQRAQQRANFALNYEKTIQQMEQSRVEFEREEQAQSANYAAVNLVDVDESGNVVMPTDSEIMGLASAIGIDPMELMAKIQLRADELEKTEIEQRSELLAQQQRQLELQAEQFSLGRAQALLPFDVQQAQIGLQRGQLALQEGAFGLERARALLPFELDAALLQATKTELDNAKTLQELESATIALEQQAKTGLTKDDSEKLLKNESYKNLKGNELLDEALKNFQSKFLEFTNGGKLLDVLSYEELATLQSMKKGLAATLKDAKTLGTLDQGVENLVNGLIGEIPELTFTGRPRVGFFRGIQSKIKSAIEQNKNEAEVNYDQLVAENPSYQSASAVQRLYRKTQGLPTSFSEWANDPNNVDAAQNLQQQIINAGGDPSNPSDVEQAWNAVYGFSTELQTSLNGESLGELSKQFESKGDPAAIGYDRVGGYSFGTYQLAHDNPIKFVKQSSFKDQFKNLDKNSQEFQNTWKRIAQQNPEKFEAEQREFIKRTHYDPQVKKIESAGFSLSSFPEIFKQVVWSTAVQHGAGSRIIPNVLKRMKGAPFASILKEIYDVRSKDFGGSTPQVQQSVKNRFAQELNTALQSLA